jgi:hypothetical protein
MAGKIGAAASDTDAPALARQGPHDMAADKARAAEHGHKAASLIACLEHGIVPVQPFVFEPAD